MSERKCASRYVNHSFSDSQKLIHTSMHDGATRGVRSVEIALVVPVSSSGYLVDYLGVKDCRLIMISHYTLASFMTRGA